MRVFNYTLFKDKKWDNEIVAYIAQIHEHKAKQELYLKQKPQGIKKLIEIAKVQSTEYSNEIEGIKTTNTRLKQIMNEKITPKNRDEEEIAGYRDVLNVIYESYEYIPILPNYILQLHKMLYAHSSKAIGGNFKSVQNYISGTDCNGEMYTIFTPLSPFETPIAIKSICDEFNKAIAENEVDELILIPIFIHDFLCIHPFLDGNGRMSRLLTTLLLCKCGYLVGQYISLEAKIAKNKNLYYDALAKSQIGWSEGQDNVESFVKYLLGIIISAYRDFEERVDIVSTKTSALDTVKKAICNIVGKFTKSQLIELCPNLSVKSIESSLKKLADENFIEKHNAG
ncbi:MAG: Fic family protein, partial [Christensenellales bacterium]